MFKIKTAIFLIIISLGIIACDQQVEVPTLKINYQQKIGWEEKSPCSVSYVLNGDTVEASAALKFRGGMSRKYYKHSIALELDEPTSLFGLPKDDDWVLNASYIDKTFMRHVLSYDLYRQMNSSNIAPKTKYVNVELMGKYEGLYVLKEEVNAGMLKMDKEASLAILLKDPPVFIAVENHHDLDTANRFNQKFPKLINSERSEYIAELVHFLFKATDQEFAKHINDWIDINSVIDWHLLLLLANNGDGVIKNFFLYKLDSKTPFRIAIWDYDHSFGRDGDGELNMMKTTLDINSSILFKRLLANPNGFYKEKLKARWFELRHSGVFTKNNLYNKIHDYQAIIQPELTANFEKWPVDGKWYYDDYSFDQEVKVMKSFIELRLPQLDIYFQELK